jgi:hypothetical protein
MVCKNIFGRRWCFSRSPRGVYLVSYWVSIQFSFPINRVWLFFCGRRRNQTLLVCVCVREFMREKKKRGRVMEALTRMDTAANCIEKSTRRPFISAKPLYSASLIYYIVPIGPHTKNPLRTLRMRKN